MDNITAEQFKIAMKNAINESAETPKQIEKQGEALNNVAKQVIKRKEKFKDGDWIDLSDFMYKEGRRLEEDEARKAAIGMAMYNNSPYGKIRNKKR